jgi:hypothetical protein
MKQHGKGPSDWLLERLALGELDAATAAEVRQRLAAEGRTVDDVIAKVAASNQEIMEQHPPTATVAAIRRRAAAAAAAAAKPNRKRAFIWGAPFALAATAAAGLLVARPWKSQSDGQERAVPVEAQEYIGIKGPDKPAAPRPVTPPRLSVYRKGAAGNERLLDGARATRGDLLQLVFQSSSGGHGVLLSIDGARKVTLHWPESDAGKAAPLTAGAELPLPSAYQLDDAPGFERFVFVRASQSFDVAPVMAAARGLAARGAAARREPLALPAGFEQVSVTVDKAPPAKKDMR